jgi:hypothetical protein
MTIERFNTDKLIPLTGNYPADFEDIGLYRPELIEILDTGVAGDVYTLRHAIGRVPKGIRIINVALPAASAVGVTLGHLWYRIESDDEWTDTEINVRFTTANLHVLLEIV